MSIKNKYEVYQILKDLFNKNSINVAPYEEINYGVQAVIEKDSIKEVLRIYENKKGIKIDFSQIKNTKLIEPVVAELKKINNPRIFFDDKTLGVSEGPAEIYNDLDKVVGIDESGKGDYFGPLVIASCFVDFKTKKILQEFGVTDSKKLTDEKIVILARRIKEICPHIMLRLDPLKYNQEYQKIKNLNYLLAMGHAIVLEKILEKVEARYAISDKFADEEVLKSKLLERGKKITLYQETNAERNIAVAAASILARDGFLAGLKDLEEEYVFRFPKGASARVNLKAEEFVTKYGEKNLPKVAKVHFKM